VPADRAGPGRAGPVQGTGTGSQVPST
jgi:hypothetical protein